MTDQRTLVLLKPDALRRNLVGPILSMYETAGLRIVDAAVRTVDPAFADQHYAEHVGKDWYPRMRAYICGGLLMAVTVEGPDAIAAVRRINGATDPLKASPDSIRGRWATCVEENLVHGSDSRESAARELALWFPASGTDRPAHAGLAAAAGLLDLLAGGREHYAAGYLDDSDDRRYLDTQANTLRLAARILVATDATDAGLFLPTHLLDRFLQTRDAAGRPAGCRMTYTEPFDFAQCETHDTTFPLGDTCKFEGRDEVDVLLEELDVQRSRAVRAETRLARAPQEMVREFLHTFGHPVADRPGLVDEATAQLRVNLIAEEADEFAEATRERDLVEVADALADLVYVCYGAALAYGIDLDAVLAEVHRSNMSKLGADGKPILRGDGKVLKSDLFSPPDIAGVLAAQVSESLPVR